MKVKFTKESFLKALGTCVSVINPRNSLPILSNLLIETVGKDEVQITGTDLEIGISTRANAEITESGAITAPAKKLFDIIREIPGGEINFYVTKNNSIHISVSEGKAGSQFKIMGIPKDDYPKLAKFNFENSLSLSQKLLKECLSLTAFAASHDESRYVLNGVFLIIKENILKVVATDGRRLAYSKKKIDNTNKLACEVIVPNKTVAELLKTLTEDGEVKIVLEKNQIIFNLGVTQIISRLIEGHFPDYEQVIPKEEKSIVKLGRDEFLQAVRRASLLTSQESQAIKVELMKNKLALSSRSPNLGEAREEFPIELQGEEMMIGFNPAYLMDVLKNIDTPEVLLVMNGPERPGVVKGKDGYIHVVMPMQLVS